MPLANASWRNRKRYPGFVIAVSLIVLWVAPPSFAQGDPRGAVARSAAARKVLILSVQQGFSTLPPTAGQSFAYKFDPKLDAFVPSEALGPTSVVSAQTVGAGAAALRASGSYFDVEETFSSIFQGGFIPDRSDRFARLGLRTEATVALANMAAVYGLADVVDVNLNVPIAIVDTEAAPKDGACNAIPHTADPSDPCLDRVTTVYPAPKQDFDADFDGGSHVGIGRISVGGKWQFAGFEAFDAAIATELFFPSPHEDEFAGTESFAIYPRLIGEYRALEFLRMVANVGYDHDFDESELRRFVWNVVAVVPIGRGVLDVGLGGAEFSDEVEFNPDEFDLFGQTIRNIGDNTVDNSYVDVLAAIKYPILNGVAASVATSIPITNDGLRPDVFVTAAIEIWPTAIGSNVSR